MPSAFPPPCLGLRLPIAVAIALAIALLIELPIEFPMHLLIAFGCLVEAFWMSFSWLFATFWKPFGTFWTPRATFFGPRDDSWPISGPGCKKLRKSYNLVELWWLPGCPIWDYFAAFDDFLAACFLFCFLGAYFSHNLQFRGPFGIQLAMLFGVPGTLGNRLKTLKGIRFSHFGGPFCRHDFQARSGDFFFIDFYDFWWFVDALSGSVLGQKCEKMEYEKTLEKGVGNIQAGLTRSYEIV